MAARRALDADRLPGARAGEGRSPTTSTSPRPTRAPASSSAATTWSGAESDQALVDSVKAAGNVILLADATYEGEAVGRRTAAARRRLPARCRRASPSARRDLPAVRRRWPAPRRASGTTCSCSIPTVRCATPCRSCAPASQALPSLGLAAALRGRAASRRASPARRRPTLRIGDRAMPLSRRAGAQLPTACSQLSVGARSTSAARRCSTI